jgi:hypothetical protein
MGISHEEERNVPRKPINPGSIKIRLSDRVVRPPFVRECQVLKEAAAKAAMHEPPGLDPRLEITREILRAQHNLTYGRIVLWDDKCVKIGVSPRLLERAIQLMNRIFSGLEQAGCEIILKEGLRPATVVKIGDREVSIVLQERLRQIKHVLPARGPGLYTVSTYRYIPTGELVFRIVGSVAPARLRQWKDRPTSRLEQRVTTIVEGIIEVCFIMAIKEGGKGSG